MTETYTVVACARCGVFWREVERATCTEDDHVHTRYELHHHRTRVILPDGARVMAVSFDAFDPYGRDHPPDFGLYLDDRWQPPWPHHHVAWPDFELPHGVEDFRAVLGSTIERARSGERIEVGCIGGHGRTGTAVACLSILAGNPASEAVAWVRTHYCTKAVETPEQEAFVVEFGAEGSRQ